MTHKFFQIVHNVKYSSRFTFVNRWNYIWCIRLQFLQSLALIVVGVILRRFRSLECLAYYDTNWVSLFYFKIPDWIFDSSYDIFIWQSLEAIEKLGLVAKGSLSIWVNLPVVLTHFLFVMLVTLRAPYFLVINSWICVHISFFLNQKIENHKITYFNDSFLNDQTPQFLKSCPSAVRYYFWLYHVWMTWLRGIHSCHKSLSA